MLFADFVCTVIRGDLKDSLFTQAHLHDTLVPTADHLSCMCNEGVCADVGVVVGALWVPCSKFCSSICAAYSDHLADTDGESERTASGDRAVENRAVGQLASVVHGHLRALLGEGLAISGSDNYKNRRYKLFKKRHFNSNALICNSMSAEEHKYTSAASMLGGRQCIS